MHAHRYGLDALEEQAQDLRVGQLLCGKWKLEELLGSGASGAVYAARHRNGHRVAIKVVRSKWAALPEMRERFLNEARASNLVEHRGVIRVHDEGVAEDGSIFLVMDLLQGRTLQEHVALHGTLSVEQALVVAHELLDVLEAAHAVGVLHRDIKPGNIFLNWDGRIVLVDFGVARLSESKFLTQAGVPVGTPSYMPPEQAAGRWVMVDARSDLWSLGATLFTLLTGQTVRQTRSLEEELRAAIAGSVRSIATVRPLPLPIIDVVDRALEPEIEDRFASAVQMRDAVRAAMTALGIELPTATELPGLRAGLTVPAGTESRPPSRHPSAVRLKLVDTLTAPTEAELWARRIRAHGFRGAAALGVLAVLGGLALGRLGLGPAPLQALMGGAHGTAPAPAELLPEPGVLAPLARSSSQRLGVDALQRATQAQAQATRAGLKGVALLIEAAREAPPERRPQRGRRRPPPRPAPSALAVPRDVPASVVVEPVPADPEVEAVGAWEFEAPPPASEPEPDAFDPLAKRR